MSEWKVICRVDDIPVLGARRVSRAQGLDVAVFRNSEDEVFALLDRCPHKGGPLSQGIVFGTSVACPLHNWAIGLDDGCADRRRGHGGRIGPPGPLLHIPELIPQGRDSLLRQALRDRFQERMPHPRPRAVRQDVEQPRVRGPEQQPRHVVDPYISRGDH